MKIFLFILGLMLLTACSTETPTVKTDLEEMKLVGKVMSIEEYSYETGQESESDKQQNTDLALQEVSKTFFNEEGRIIEAYFFNNNGTLIKKEISSYDKIGRKIETNTYNPEGKLIFQEVYKYDNKGNEIVRIKSKADGTLFKKFEIKYNNRGQFVEIYKYDSTGGLEVRDEYKFRDYKEPFELNRYLLGRLFFTLTFEYDSLGNMKSYYQKGVLSGRNKQAYFLYEFDTVGNWIKKHQMINGEITSFTEREIKYWQ